MSTNQDVQKEVAEGSTTWADVNSLVYTEFPLIIAHLNQVLSLLDSCIEAIRAMDPKLEVPQSMYMVEKASFIANWFSAQLTAQMALEQARQNTKRK